MQIDSIDLADFNDGNSWVAIGSEEDFSGTYDGNDFSISNLFIFDSDANNLGLFSDLKSGAEIRGVSLINVDITEQNSVGALAGQTRNDVVIENCSASGKVTGNFTVSGLIGYSRSAIENSSANITIVANSNVGGLVGQASGTRGEDDGNGDIISSSAYGNVTGSQENVGGLIGRSIDNKVLASHSYGEVVGKDDSVGGFIGNAGRVRIDESTASGKVTGTGEHVGGFIGTQGVYGIAGGNITNSFAYGDVTGKDSQVGGFSGYLQKIGMVLKK